MTSGTRLPSWKEREKNRRRERRRRAIAANIYTGLRMYGNYKLPKLCDNNEVLKALCTEAGWVVEEDGLTYRKGTKAPERIPETGFLQSPFMSSAASSSYPSPASSTCPSPNRSSYGVAVSGDGASMVPWLNGLPSAKVLSYGGSCSAPLTPPSICCSPSARDGPKCSDWDALAAKSRDIARNSTPVDCAATALLNAWSNHADMVAPCPPSPLMRSRMSYDKGCAEVDVMAGEKVVGNIASSSRCFPSSGIASPTPMGMWVAPWAASSSATIGPPREKTHISMWRPGYSYVSPAASVCTGDGAGEIQYEGGLKEVVSDSSPPPVKAWAGEQIHDACPDIYPQDLELKL